MVRARGGAATRDLHRAVGRGVSGKGWIETVVPVRVTHASVEKRKRRECGDLATHETAAAACLPVCCQQPCHGKLKVGEEQEQEEEEKQKQEQSRRRRRRRRRRRSSSRSRAGGVAPRGSSDQRAAASNYSSHGINTTKGDAIYKPREGRSSKMDQIIAQKRSSSPPSCNGISKPKKCDKHQGESGTFMSTLLSKFLWPVTFHKREERVCK
jgi:hypothetical protein